MILYIWGVNFAKDCVKSNGKPFTLNISNIEKSDKCNQNRKDRNTVDGMHTRWHKPNRKNLIDHLHHTTSTVIYKFQWA